MSYKHSPGVVAAVNLPGEASTEFLLKYIERLENALADLCDGALYRAHEIHGETGLPMERCEEIAKLACDLLNRDRGR